MSLPKRRERDETRKLQDMGKALGWHNWKTTGGRSISNPNVNDNSLETPGRGHVNVIQSMVPAKFQGTRGIGGKQ